MSKISRKQEEAIRKALEAQKNTEEADPSVENDDIVVENIEEDVDLNEDLFAYSSCQGEYVISISFTVSFPHDDNNIILMRLFKKIGCHISQMNTMSNKLCIKMDEVQLLRILGVPVSSLQIQNAITVPESISRFVDDIEVISVKRSNNVRNNKCKT